METRETLRGSALRTLVHSLPKRNGNETKMGKKNATPKSFTAYLKGMETSTHATCTIKGGRVHSLPKRNGNSRRLNVVWVCRLVHSLPKRNGNFGTTTAATGATVVHSLPKRNGNYGEMQWKEVAP